MFVSSGARGLKFGLYFHLYLYFVYASSESISAGFSLLVNEGSYRQVRVKFKDFSRTSKSLSKFSMTKC